MNYPQKREEVLSFDENIVFKFTPECYEKGLIAR